MQPEDAKTFADYVWNSILKPFDKCANVSGPALKLRFPYARMLAINARVDKGLPTPPKDNRGLDWTGAEIKATSRCCGPLSEFNCSEKAAAFWKNGGCAAAPAASQDAESKADGGDGGEGHGSEGEGSEGE